MRILLKSFLVCTGIMGLFTVGLTIRYIVGRHQANMITAVLKKIRITLPPVDSAEILPIVEYRSTRSDLRTEDGIAYLIKAGGQSLLMDVGYNRKAEDLSPLLHNMDRLDLSLNSIDAFVISHCHPDHVGGMGFRKKQVNIASSPTDLQGKRVYTPIPMTCATGKVLTVDKPTLITTVVASTGPLAAQIFVPGQLREQALLINIRDKGLVLISGCGHPEIVNMVKAAQEMTDLPVYAVVGGLHMYYTRVDALFWRNLFGSSRLFSRSMTKQEVLKTIHKLKQMGIEKIFVSPHDADQATLGLFEEVFEANYDMVMAGKPITLGGR